MRIARAVVVLVAFVAIGAGVALSAFGASGGGSGGYLVRAVFDNSSFVIPGEEIKIAGVTVGTIDTIQLTPQNKAAVVLRITNRRFEPFRTDAHCEIGLESLLGEQFVQCTPTQPRAPGAAHPAPLPAIAAGPNSGQHLLPVQNTTAPVGFDLLQNIYRLPERERLQLIIAGLGAGLDANGEELNAALLRADPALQQTDRVIAVLASQDRTLARLTDESARVLEPLTVQRAHLGGFIDHAGEVAVASAREGQAIEENLSELPPFLHQLGPAAARLTNLAEQATPALQALQAQAPAVNATVKDLGPLARASIPALQTLGDVAQRGETVFPRVNGLAHQLLALGTPLAPLATDIAAVAQSFDDAGGIEDVMRFIYYYAGAVNGEDALGHYVRSHVTLGAVQRTSTAQAGSGSATFACSLVTSRCPGLSATARLPQSRHGLVAVAVRRAISSTPATSGENAKALMAYLMAP